MSHVFHILPSRIDSVELAIVGITKRMLTKYCIDQLIKNWDIYLNQTLFATRIRTHTTTDFSLFYLLYDINSSLLDDADESTLVHYDERVDFASFLSKERAETFKKTMQRAKKNKKIWDAKMKNNVFTSKQMILIRTKKSKKFEIDWYEFYEVVRVEILNIYMLKSSKSSSNKYLINDDRMKLTNVDENIIKDWRMSRDRERSRKTAIEKSSNLKRKRERSRKTRKKLNLDADFDLVLLDDLYENSEQTI